MGITKPGQLTETKLMRIAALSKADPDMEFKWLMPHFNKDSLAVCFNALDGKKAVGVDGVTKEEYGKNLEANIRELTLRMKSMSYKPKPVKKVLIPKEGKKKEHRPLGISTLEDKVVQLMTSKVLNAVYDPIFRNCSYGFRPTLGCHKAIKAVSDHLYRNQCETVLDVDLEDFFGTIDHGKLVDFLRIKIKDERFIRYIVRMLKSGVLSSTEGFSVTEEGSPQGNVASPVLANIFAHYVIDSWFENVVVRHTRGSAKMFRYADDIIICCGLKSDAERIKKALDGRLMKHSLKLNKEKTKMVPFSRKDHLKGKRQGTFDFLGFAFYIGKSRRGGNTVMLKTSEKRLRSKLGKVKLWCKSNRNKTKMSELWEVFCSKLAGHIRYYAVSFNKRYVLQFIEEAKRIFFKWMNRRSQRKSLTWTQIGVFLSKYPTPKVRIYHSLF